MPFVGKTLCNSHIIEHWLLHVRIIRT